MIVASEDYPGNNETHARGLAAILHIQSSPQDLLGATRYIQPAHLSGSDHIMLVRT